ncbi:MAG: SH3-like domain-containing protein [Acetobacteraceae bacterium]
MLDRLDPHSEEYHHGSRIAGRQGSRLMRFQAGAPVMVRDWPEARGPAHVRTPHYLRGRPGTIIRYMGRFADPERLAFGRPADLRALYHVAFRPCCGVGTMARRTRPSWLNSMSIGWSPR